MSSNRKLTEWFGKSSSSSQGSSSSKSTPPSQNAKPRSETSRVAAATKGGSTRPSSSHNSVSSNPSSSASKPKSATRPVTIDIDSSIEMVSASAPRKQASQKSSSTRTAGSSSSSSKESRTALTKLKTSSALPLQAKQQPASPVVIDLSSSPDTPSSKSIITISDDSSDMISLPLKRSNSNTSAMSEAKRRRTSNNSSSSSSPLVRPVMAQATSSDEDEEKHVEINLTMPDMEDIGQDDGGPSSAVDANANAMDWVPTPPSHIEPSPFSSFKPLDASPRSAQSGSDVEMSEQEASVGRNPPKNLPRRSRLASTPPTSVSPQGPVTASESSKDIIARMTQNLRSASETSSDDDDLKAAKALAAESSDSDGDSDDELLLVPSKSSSSAAKKPAASSRSTRPGLFSSSSLSSVPDGEDTPMSEAGDSSPEPIARRRSSRKVNPPKPTVPLTPTLTKPRGGKSVFDKLLTEHTRRQKNRGGVDGYQRAQEALESSESEDEQQSNVNGSVAGQSHRSGHSRSRHSRHSSILPDSADETTSDDANGEDDEFASADKLAQELLGEENAKAIRHLTEGTGARKGSKHTKRGNGELKMVRASRRLWERALNPVDPPLEPRLKDSLVSRIYNATRSEKALEATMHLQRCGRSDPSVRRQLVSALLPAAICATDVLLADSATSKLVQMIRHSPDELESMGLRLQDVIASACSALGARPDIIKTLFLAQNDPLGFGQAAQQYSIMARGKAHRALCVSRYMQLLDAIGSTDVLNAEDISDVAQFTLAIACDPSATPEVERQATSNLHRLFSSIDLCVESGLLICKALVKAFDGARHPERLLAIQFLPNHEPSMRRLQSWTAYGFLSPPAIARLTPERFASPPPLSALLSQLIGRGTANSSSSLFCIDEEMDKEQEQDGPDYDDVCAQMQLLDVMLRDLKAFILYERAQAKEQAAPASGNTIMSLGSVFTISTAAKPKTTLERLINELPALHERIVDGGAQNLGKTRLKNAIQNLLTRLAAQHKSITDAIRYQAGAPARMSLESHFRNSSAAAKGSPPPQILIDDDEDEDELQPDRA